MSSKLWNVDELQGLQKAMQRVMKKHKEASDSFVRINDMLEDIALYYEAERVLVVETDWCFGYGNTTFEYHSPFVDTVMHKMQNLDLEDMAFWREKLKKNQHVIMKRGEYRSSMELFDSRDTAANYVMAIPIHEKFNTGFIAIINPKRRQKEFLFFCILAAVIAGELNGVKLEERIDIVIRQTLHCKESDVYVKGFGGLAIRGSKGKLGDEQITSEQCYRLLAYMLLNKGKTRPVRELADLIWNDVPISDPYHDLKNVVYRLKRYLASAGMEDFIIGSGGTFIINPKYNVYTDFELFETTCLRYFKEADLDLSASDYFAAKDLYKGILFPRCESSHHFLPVISYYQNLYLKLLKTHIYSQFQLCNHLCVQKTAIDGLDVEPYDTDFMTYQLISMYQQDNHSLANSYYQKVMELLSAEQKRMINEFR